MIFKAILVSTLATVLCIEVCSAAEAYQTNALNAHNTYRAKHHAPALTMDETLNANAMKCAQYYAEIQAIDHSCPYKGEAGENLVGGAGSWTQDQFATMGTKMWYDEVSAYDYNNPGFTMATGHFTQLVWKNSQSFGFGVVNLNGYTAGVGLYDPAGNYDGEFAENVLRP